METFEILKIYKNTENANGEPYITATGSNFTLVKVTVMKDGQETKISCIDFDGLMNDYNVGDQLTVKLEDRNGYLNFEPVSRVTLLEARIEALEKLVMTSNPPEKKAAQVKTEQCDISDLPF